ncbi:MAG: hypothetical protein V3S03_05005 [Vicinamibacteria bacterium]
MNQTTALPTPGWLGRGIRLSGAAFVLYFVAQIVAGYRLGGSPSPRDPMFWLALVAIPWVLPEVVHLGFRLHWGRWPRYAFLALLLVGGGVDLARGAGVPGPAFGLVFFATAAYAFGHLGLSLLVSSIDATPG